MDGILTVVADLDAAVASFVELGMNRRAGRRSRDGRCNGWPRSATSGRT
jgi:hypothetical protein